jgi:hypothetical protein
MFEYYVKLFHLNWIEPWMVEALGIVFGGLLLALVVAKVADSMDQLNQ